MAPKKSHHYLGQGVGPDFFPLAQRRGGDVSMFRLGFKGNEKKTEDSLGGCLSLFTWDDHWETTTAREKMPFWSAFSQKSGTPIKHCGSRKCPSKNEGSSQLCVQCPSQIEHRLLDTVMN